MRENVQLMDTGAKRLPLRAARPAATRAAAPGFALGSPRTRQQYGPEAISGRRHTKPFPVIVGIRGGMDPLLARFERGDTSILQPTTPNPFTLVFMALSTMVRHKFNMLGTSRRRSPTIVTTTKVHLKWLHVSCVCVLAFSFRCSGC